MRESPGSESDGGEDDPSTHHEPVLLHKVIELLAPGPGLVFVDGTVGAAGHFSAVASHLSPGGVAVGIDRDERSLKRARARLKQVEMPGVAIHLVHAGFSELARVVNRLGLAEVDRILLDLGLSSDQLEDPERGFSFQHDGPLDMRQDRRSRLTAYEVVNGYSPQALLEVLQSYGEERFARRIVEAIVARRKAHPIAGTLELAELVAKAVPVRGRIHPATRTFQALRIEVGGEVDELRAVLPQAAGLLRLEGRLAVITFHGLEERLVKEGLRPFSRHAVRTDWQLNRLGDVIKPDEAEQRRNPRSRSAKLRVYRKVATG